jgi:cysteine desulfurase
MNYFDNNATTPVSAEVLEAMTRVLREEYGNASSIHSAGQSARRLVEEARAEVALLIGAEAKEIVFTSGATESDNLAVFSAPAGHIVTTSIEHPAVLAACRERGDYTEVPVGRDGVVDPDDVTKALRPTTTMISVMHANNETGALQPVAEIAKIAREAGALFHSDGVHAAARVPIDVRALGVDLYSITGHKFYAPKGTGVLFVREGVAVKPRQFGGRHERGRRPGTENVAGVVALGRAAMWVLENLASEALRLAALRDRLENGILTRVTGTRVNAAGVARTPNTSNIAFERCDGEAMVIALDLAGFAVSSGAACASGAVTPSHVLSAMGLTAQEARTCLRFSLGRYNDEQQVDALIEAVAAIAARQRKLSPVTAHA